MNQQQYIARHYERLFAMGGISAIYRLPHPDDDAPAVLDLPVTIVPATTSVDHDNGDVTIESRIADYLVRGEELMHDGALIIPDEKHRIIITSDVPWAQQSFMRPLPPTDGVPLWRWSDPHRTVLRIHTREVPA